MGSSTGLRGKFVSGITIDVDYGHHRAFVSHSPRRSSSDARAASGYHGSLAVK